MLKAALIFCIILCLSGYEARAHTIQGGESHFSSYMQKISKAMIAVTLAHIDRNGPPVQEQQSDIIAKIRFNPPADAHFMKDKSYGIFLPEGGGVPYEQASFLYMANVRMGTWNFNAEFNTGDFRQVNLQYPEKRVYNEVIAFLVGVREAECLEVVAPIEGKKTIPQLKSDQSALYKKSMVTGEKGDYEIPYTEGPKFDHPQLDAARFGCFLSHDGKDYVFFNNVLEN